MIWCNDISEMEWIESGSHLEITSLPTITEVTKSSQYLAAFKLKKKYASLAGNSRAKSYEHAPSSSGIVGSIPPSD